MAIHKKFPRIMLTAPCSGSGKTLLTGGILKALMDQKMEVSSFKCGPDYIDPLFHQKILYSPCYNLDPFFLKEENLKELFARHAQDKSISVIEGVMGYYDGIGGNTLCCSSFDLAARLDCPAVLIVNAKGASTSLAALVSGYLNYQPNSRIKGIILNQISPLMYPVIKELLESTMPIRVIGYVPQLPECTLPSRHLGLFMPSEIKGFQDIFEKVSKIMQKSIDWDSFFAIAGSASDLCIEENVPEKKAKNVCVAVARDEAFCFQYEDNLELLKQLGARLLFFSPLHDKCLPPFVDALILGGGYPEIYAEQLETAEGMRQSVKKAILGGMPVIAECGGFLYLKETITDQQGKTFCMAGVLPGGSHDTGRLKRFGYVTLKAGCESLLFKKDEEVPAHEFHYYDSDDNGTDFLAVKASGKNQWECGKAGENMYAGFPHLYYNSNPNMITRFLKKAAEYREREKIDEADKT